MNEHASANHPLVCLLVVLVVLVVLVAMVVLVVLLLVSAERRGRSLVKLVLVPSLLVLVLVGASAVLVK